MENGWKMEDGKCTPHGPPPSVAFKWYPFFAAHTFMSTKIKCQHCELPSVRIRLTDGYKFYCARCGWNHQIVQRELSFAIRVQAILLCLAVLLVVVARLKTLSEWRVWAGIVIVFSALPAYYALSSFSG